MEQRWADAEPNYLALLPEIKRLPLDSQTPLLSRLYSQLIKFYTAWDKPAEAQKWQEALDKLPQQMAD